MPRIAILPSSVADQIAAGEVIERPASVVKELVENALDAGSTAIDITVEDGGRTLIRIADNGSGMDRSDASMAIARHATSKISTAAELVGVRSFGFRGEALAAIASVSEMQIETALEDGNGTLIRMSGSRVLETADASRRKGTTVSVHRLFFNTPARLKFLRGARSEWRNMAETLQAIGIMRRDVHFRVWHDGRLVSDWPAVGTLRARVGAIWGPDEAARFVDVDDVQSVVHVSGLVERPSEVGRGTRRVLLVVNGRVVRDHGIVRAAEAAYRSTIPAGLRPSAVLSIRMPGSDVDVNVHPAKAEVRFRDRWSLERVVEEAVRRALGLFDASAGIGWPSGTDAASRIAADGEIRELAEQLAPRDLLIEQSNGALFECAGDLGAVGVQPEPPDDLQQGVPDGLPSNGDIPTSERLVVPRLTQWRLTYIVFEHDDGVVMIDQHSAHERVLYERFMGVLERGEAPSQRLLFPMTLHLGPREAEAFEEHAETLGKIGFEIQPFGGSTLAVHSVPMPHPRFDAEYCLRETLASLSGDRGASSATKHEHLAATVACKAAIKSGDRLSPGEMEALYRSLASTRLAAHDVHGRSTIVRISWDEIDRRFGRK